MNYTHINMLEITRFRSVKDSSINYRFYEKINLYRDQSDDSFDLGRIGFSVYNQTLLLTMEKQLSIDVKLQRLCRYNQTLDNFF